VSLWCPLGYLGYSFLKFEPHNKYPLTYRRPVYYDMLKVKSKGEIHGYL
jgi:hypothetical protein